MNTSEHHDSRHRGTPDVPWVVRLTQDLETTEQLDRLDPGLWPIARALVSAPPVRDALQGRWLGHALHPLLTDLPIGAWTSATVLDFIGGADARRSAERLLAVGVLGAVPTAVTGLAEWTETSGRDRRVGLVHAGANIVALGLYATSLASRRRGRHATGVALSLAGGAVAGVGGYLGSHLSLGRKVSTRHPAVAGPPAAGEQ